MKQTGPGTPLARLAALAPALLLAQVLAAQTPAPAQPPTQTPAPAQTPVPAPASAPAPEQAPPAAQPAPAPAAAPATAGAPAGGGAGRQTRPRPEPRTFVAGTAETPVRVDGVLDDAAWAAAEPFDLPYEYFPADNAPAPVRTECRLAYDAATLYFACTAHDPEPHRIRANFTDRDAALGDDNVSLFLDPFHDQRRAFQFRINPLGVQMDATYSELYKSEDFTWDAIWTSAARRTEQGYVVEAAIPFSALRFPGTSDVQTWGIMVGRTYPRSVVHRLRSSFVRRNDACVLCQADRLTGLRGMRPGRGIELTPTLTTRRSDARTTFPDGALKTGEVKPELGFSGRWSVTPNVTLNATVNPDFSQVEADVAQLQVNERFALSYPEKRPFFLEGADFFQTPLDLVFTRSLIEPTGGVKLTGKEGAHAFAAFAVQDRFTSLLFPSNAGTAQALLQEDVQAVVGRYRRDVGRASTLGVLYTGRMGEDYGNHVAGVDGTVRLSPAAFVRFQYAHSQTDYPDSIAGVAKQRTEAFGGDMFNAVAVSSTRSWILQASYLDVGPRFRADAGFVPRADFRQLTTRAERVYWGRPGHWFRRLSVAGAAYNTMDYSGRLTDQSWVGTFSYQGSRQSTVGLAAGHNRRYFAGKTYTLLDARPTVQVSPSQRVTFTLSSRFGHDIDIANRRRAGIVQINPSVDLRLGRRFSLGGGYATRRLGTLSGDSVGAGREILKVRLTQMRAMYHLNVRTYLRAIVQYQDTRLNPEVYRATVTPERRTLFAQLLFSYKVNPQTVVFAGYTDDRLGLQSVDLTPTGRTFFLKLGYNFQP